RRAGQVVTPVQHGKTTAPVQPLECARWALDQDDIARLGGHAAQGFRGLSLGYSGPVQREWRGSKGRKQAGAVERIALQDGARGYNDFCDVLVAFQRVLDADRVLRVAGK